MVENSIAENKPPVSILIVDDEASNLLILNKILKDDYTVYAARSGEAALKIAREKQPSLILLDVVLPDISGHAVLTALKEDEATRGIPVIIISGLGGADYTQIGYRLGADGYITKPFNTADVRAAVGTRVGGSTGHAAEA